MIDEGRAGRWIRRIVLVAIWIFILAPIVAVFAASVGPSPLPRLPPEGFSLHWYRVALQEADVVSALSTSTLVGAGSALLALIVATPAAYAIVRFRFRGRRLAETVIVLPIILPQIIIGIGLVIFFSRAGVLTSIQQLIVAHAIVILPFAARIMTTSFAGIQHELEEAAKVLGASAVGAFGRVVLPLARVGMVAAAALAFVISFTQFTVSLFIFSGEAKPYPIWMYQALTSDYTPMIPIAVSGMVIVFIILLVVVLERLSGFAGVVSARER